MGKANDTFNKFNEGIQQTLDEIIASKIGAEESATADYNAKMLQIDSDYSKAVSEIEEKSRVLAELAAEEIKKEMSAKPSTKKKAKA